MVVIKVAIDWESMNEVVGIGSGCDKSSGIVSVVLVKLIEDQVRSLILSLIVIVVHQMVRGVVILLGWRLSFFLKSG